MGKPEISKPFIGKCPPASLVFILVSFLLLVEAIRLFAQPDRYMLKFQHAVYGPSRGVHFKNPAGIAFDRYRKEIYVADSGNHRVSIFDLDGRYLTSFPCHARDPRTGVEIETEPRSVAIGRDGEIYITDTLSGKIQVKNFRGESLSYIDVSRALRLTDRRAIPEYLFMDSKGLLYVTTSGDVHNVVVLDSNKDVIHRIKGTGTGFAFLTGIWVDDTGMIYVTDATASPCVQVYNKEGTYLFGFGEKDVGDSNFSHPHGVATTSNGEIWVVDSIRQVVKRFDREGHFIEMRGGFGIRAGDLLYPDGIAGNGADRLFLLERVGGRYQSFRMVKANEQ